EVAEFLGISFSPNLLLSTFGGKPWGGIGVTRENKVVYGTNPQIIEKDIEWKTGWSIETQQFFHKLLAPLAQRFGYPVPPLPTQQDFNPHYFLEAEKIAFQEYPERLIHRMKELYAPLKNSLWNTPPFSKEQIEYQSHCMSDTQAKYKSWSEYPTYRQEVIQYILQWGQGFVENNK
ncbi:MAG: hypothetical protein K2X66_01085, partial [Cyanobacteria bacterium]|nr:hypothetical protein [Cyanobacteriota bacterium]